MQSHDYPRLENILPPTNKSREQLTAEYSEELKRGNIPRDIRRDLLLKFRRELKKRGVK